MPSPDYRDAGLTFPDDFQFGSATASYQIEGAFDEDGRGPSVWDTFSKTPGKVVGGDTGDVAIDHYHRLDEDLDHMAFLGLDTYRFSIAWPRIQPTGAGAVNQRGIDFYNRLIDGLLARDIRPIATLYHWDHPQPLEDAGGWPQRDIALRFGDYAEIVGRAFGDRVDTFTTLNEPYCSSYLGYASGMHAPGVTDGAQALAAVHHHNLAHGLGVQALRASAPSAKCSVTHNLQVAYPADDVTGPEAVRRVEALANRAFTGPTLRGEYPSDLIEDTAGVTDWSFVLDGDTAIAHQPIDVLGINYYNTMVVRMRDAKIPAPSGPTAWPGSEGVEFLPLPGPKTDMGWNIAPEGLEKLLLSMHEQFPGLPLMVTENGAAYDHPVVDGRVHDAERTDYVHRHLVACHRAMEAGADLRGYQLWSLFDNFEWSQGYAKRFGIIHVDYETLERTYKDTALWYREVIRTRTLPPL